MAEETREVAGEMTTEEALQALREKVARADKLQKKLDLLRGCEKLSDLDWQSRDELFARGKKLLIDEAQAELESMFSPPKMPQCPQTDHVFSTLGGKCTHCGKTARELSIEGTETVVSDGQEIGQSDEWPCDGNQQ